MLKLINIPNIVYDWLTNGFPNEDDVEHILEILRGGITLSDNATNGDIIKAIFPQWKIIDDADKDMIMFNIPMKVGYEFNACSKEWWNSPYK